MLSRIDVFKIVRDHFKTFGSHVRSIKRIVVMDYILFIVIPLTIAILFDYNDVSMAKTSNGIIAALAIFGGFLFNLLAIIYSQIDKLKLEANDPSEPDQKLKKLFIGQIHSNISYAILMCLVSVGFLFCYRIESDFSIYKSFSLSNLINILNIFILVHLFLTLLMVINRVYVLLKRSVI